ncbi:hypothetical protein AU255_07855 [Methyloprofundus sedimenti]|uniref:RCK N-terminal domain-containing protein n=1 Tax=Methyloprofundus sedimenti TaxID=1420851 RepID=A0A1V8M8D6_9GAMM|nr:NAD-binding protein [Methyloprofundus sedimenti]OQK17766.1 hypothetical protein AU255_07855 [Methyloprofundus sedimenti]
MLKLSKLQSLFLLEKKWLVSFSWFPQVPLALASALAGLMYLAPVMKATLGWDVVGTQFANELGDLVDPNILGISQSAIGALLLIMSLGLFLRSRLAWATCVLVIFFGLALQLTILAKSIHWWRIIFDGIILMLLLPAYHRFDRHNVRLGTLFALASVIVLNGYAVLGAYYLGDQFVPPITDLTTALYFIVVTITSVGYGDITPITMEARVFLISVITLGITVVSVSLGATLIPAFLNHLEKVTGKRNIIMERNNHYIIVGFSALASNTYRELTDRGEKVTVIMLSSEESKDPKFSDIDVVVGDGSDINTLKIAGGEEAKAILALLNDDSENAFVILAAKELDKPVKTVAAVNDVKNMNRIRKVHPSFVIAPQVLGSELLTMALTGEKVDSSTIMQRLMGQAKLVSDKD